MGVEVAWCLGRQVRSVDEGEAMYRRSSVWRTGEIVRSGGAVDRKDVVFEKGIAMQGG